MSRSRFFNKVSGQRAATSFRGATSKSFVMVMFSYMLIAILYAHFFLRSQLFRGRSIVPWLHPYRPLVEIRDRFKEKILFLEIYNFGTKNQQNRGRFKVLCFWDKRLTKLG